MSLNQIVIKSFLIFSIVFLFQARATAEDAQYVGAQKCKKCHLSKKLGAQYKIWSSTDHAKAYKTLSSEESLKTAKEKGIADATKSEECLKCHTTAYGKDNVAEGFDITNGVQCESCHGPASKHIEIREKAKKEKIEIPVTKEEFNTKPNKETCVKCHNENSPSFKGFDFEKHFKKISHPKPKD